MTKHKKYSISKELTLLLKLSDKHEINNLDKTAIDSIDLNTIKDLIAYHKVGIQIYDNIGIATKRLFPDELYNFLKAIKNKQTLHSLKIAKILVDVKNHFTDHDIPFIVLKGPVTAIQTYGTINSRQYNDIDILIPEEKMSDASKLIETVFPSSINVNMLNIFPIDQRNCILKKIVHNSYYCKEFAVPLDIHQKLFLNHFNQKEFDNYVNDFEMVKIQNVEYYSLPKNVFLLFQFYHGAKHYWSKLKYLKEIHDYLISMKMSENEWNNIESLAYYYGIFNCLIQGLKLLKLVFNYEIPEAFSNKSINSFLIKFPIEQLNSNNNYNISVIQIGKYKWLLFNRKLINIQSRIGFSLNDILLFPLPIKFFPLYFWARPLFVLYRKITNRYPFSELRHELYKDIIANNQPDNKTNSWT